MLNVTRGRSRTASSGQAMIELALIAPLLIVLVLGIVDYGGFLQAQQNMITIARSGARYAALHADPTTYLNYLSTSDSAPPATVQGVMQAEAGTNYALPNSDIRIDYYDNSAGTPGTPCGNFTRSGYVDSPGYSNLAGSPKPCLETSGQALPLRLLKVTVTYAYSSVFPLLAAFHIPVTDTEWCWMLEKPS